MSGITADTAKRRLLGEGVLYKNYGVAGERLLGAVRSGTFDPGITLAQGEVAGALGILKGLDHVESCLPTIQAMLLEITKENLAEMLAGGSTAGAGSRTLKPAEWFGLGDGATAIYPLTEDYVWDGSLQVWWDLGWGPVLLTEGATEDYTVVYATGVVTFNANVPAATAGTSRSGVAPVLDMTAHAADVNGIVSVDGGAPAAIVYAWAGCTTGALTAAQIQIAIQALGGDFAAVTCTYVANVPGVSDYYLITSNATGVTSIFECTSGAPNDAHVHLNLGVGEGGTETYGDDAANLTAEYHYDPSDGVAVHDVVTGAAFIAETDYCTNIAWLGRCVDQPTAGKELVIVIHNALPIEMAEWTLEEKGPIGVQVTFRGSVSGAAPQTLPFEIRRPVPA